MNTHFIRSNKISHIQNLMISSFIQFYFFIIGKASAQSKSFYRFWYCLPKKKVQRQRLNWPKFMCSSAVSNCWQRIIPWAKHQVWRNLAVGWFRWFACYTVPGNDCYAIFTIDDEWNRKNTHTSHCGIYHHHYRSGKHFDLHRVCVHIHCIYYIGQ